MLTRPVRIDELTWVQYHELIGQRPVIIPIGAIEQHGTHLPLGTDALCATAYAEAVSTLNGALVAPTLSYGYRSIPRSGGGEEFPGTTGLSAQTITATVEELLEQFSKDGARSICVLSGHFENRIPIHEAAFRFTSRVGDTRIMSMLWGQDLPLSTLEELYPSGQAFPGFELEHAAFLETSVMLHLYPRFVQERRSVQEIARFPPYDLYPAALGAIPESGSLAPSMGASAAAGKRLFDDSVAGLVAAMAEAFGSR